MKLRKSTYFLLLSTFLFWHCKAYKPLEKATIPVDTTKSETENLARQLAALEKNDRISIGLGNRTLRHLIFQSVDQDSVTINILKPKDAMPTKIPLNRVHDVKVQRFNVPLTALLIGGGAAVAVVIAYSSFEYDWAL